MGAKVEIEDDMNMEPSQVKKFYEGRNILITGGSGFIGKLLLQKLFRNCSNISKVYLLIRSKKDKTPEQRFDELFRDIVFDRLKAEQPNFGDKIEMIIGDIEQPNLGINESDRKMLEQEVNIIFHIAATVKFTEKLKKAVTLNVRATWDLVNLAKNMPNLKAFLHVSTAFSFCPRKIIKEVIYDTPITPERIIQMIDTLNDKELDALTPHLIGDWPNTYAFTKALAEKVIQEQGTGLPLLIVRPSMVISTHKDPIEGWINNFYGPVGIGVATGVGILRVLYAHDDKRADMIPGDIVINNMIVTTSYIGSKLNKNNFDEISNISNIPVFNCVSGVENPITWRKYYNFSEETYLQWIPINAVWYSLLILCPYQYLSTFLQFFLETIPAYMFDFGLRCAGKKPRMVKIYDKLHMFVDIVTYFTTNDWNFNNNNTQALWNYINNTDKKLFPFSVKEVNWRDYFKDFAVGLRLYLVKDPLDTLPKAQARYKKLKYAHYSVVTIFCVFCAYVIYKFLLLFM